MISWKEYWTGMGLGLLFYYGWLLVKYFPALWPGSRAKGMPKGFVFEEFKEGERPAPGMKEERVEERPLVPVEERPMGPAAEKSESVKSTMPPPPLSSQLELPLPPEKPREKLTERPMERPVNLQPVAEALISEVKGLIGKAAENKVVEGELMFWLQMLLDQEGYRVLGGSYFEESINEIIGSELANKCSIHLGAVELSGLWKR